MNARKLLSFAIAVALAGCASHATDVTVSASSEDALGARGGIKFAEPDEAGIDSQTLVDLATFIRDGQQPFFSLLISKKFLPTPKRAWCRRSRAKNHVTRSIREREFQFAASAPSGADAQRKPTP